MVTVGGLDPDVASVGTALGLLAPVPGGHRLVEDFFVRPWIAIGGLVSDEVQRGALVDALQALVPSVPPAVLDQDPAAGGVRRCHPLLEPGGAGQLYLVTDRDSAAPSAPLLLGLAAEGQPAAGGPGVSANLPLLHATGDTVTAVAATADHPLRIELRVPLGDSDAEPVVVVAVQLVAPPDLDRSRIAVELHGLPGAAAPLVVDPFGSGGDAAGLAVALLQLALAGLGSTVPDPVRAVADALPTLLGLAAGVPELPLADVAADPGAFRSWLAGLLVATADDGRAALLPWLDAVARLLDVPPTGATVLPTETEPARILVLAGPPSVEVTVGVRTDPATGVPVLIVGVRVEHPGSAGLDAVLRADAVLLAVPLAGEQPATVLERVDALLEAPAGAGPLVPAPGDPAGVLTVGRLRAGMRHQTGGTTEPLLELDDVTVDLGAGPQTFERIDLTDADSLSAAAEGLLDAAITAGLGTGSDAVEALRTLLGLGTDPGLDLGRFASEPTRALADLYRALRADPDGWPGVLTAVATLLGTSTGAGGAEVSGDGTAAAPWQLPLDAFPAPAGSAVALSVLLWDSGDATTPDLRLGLGLQARPDAPPAGEWSVDWRCELLGVALPSGGGGSVRWLGGQRLQAGCALPGPGPAVAGVGVSADSVALSAAWTPGAPLAVEAVVEAVRVAADGAATDLGDLVWPPPGGLDLSAPDLGLGLDPELLWTALRPLLVRYAGSAGGAAVRDLLALVGIVGPGSTGSAAELPALALGPGGLRDLLAAPLEAVRGWLAGLATDAAVAASAGVPFLVLLLRAGQAVLAARTPPLPGQPTPPPDLPVTGIGSPDAPWTVPLHSAGEPAVEVVGWLEPAGPPATWAVNRVLALGGGPPDGPADLDGTGGGTDDSTDDGTDDGTEPNPPAGVDLVAAASEVAGYLPGGAVLAAADPGAAAAALDALATQLLAGDGLVDAGDVLAAAEAGWRTVEPVDAAHHRLSDAPEAVAAVRAEIAGLTGGLATGDWAVVLLAPPLAGADPWAGLLDGIAAADVASISLRGRGVPPEQVDLGTVTAAAYYVVDLADDGVGTAAAVATSLARVVDAVLREKPGARVVLVGHSYLGAAAAAHVDAAPETVLGVVTLGTPHTGEVAALADPVVADGVRLAAALAPGGLPGTPSAQDALAFLADAADGYAAPEPGRPPVPAPLPLGAFSRWDLAELDLHGVPALALAGRIGGDLRQGLAGALAVDVLAAAADPRPATHAAWGIRTGLDLGSAADGEPDAAVTVSVELGRFALLPAALVPDRPPRLEVRATLRGAGGWLLGGPGAGTSQEARVRAADLVAVVTPGAAPGDGPVTSVDVALYDAALRGDAAAVSTLGDARTPELLDRLVRALDAGAGAGGRVDTLLDALADLGVVRRAVGTQPAAVLADGLAGLRTDGTGWCAARLPGLLDRPAGLLGLARPAGAPAGGGPWSFAHPRLAVETVVEPAPWRVTVHTTGSGLPLGPAVGPVGATLTATGTADLARLEPTVDAELAAGGVRLVRDASGGPALAGSWLDPPLPLTGIDPQAVLARLAPLLPRLLVDAGLGAVLEDLHGQPVVSLGLLLADPGRWLAATLASADAALPDPDRLAALLHALAAEAGLDGGADAPLALPGGLLVRAEPVDGGLRLSVLTRDPVPLWEDGEPATLAVDLHLDLDADRAVRPGGALTLHLPLPGGWPALDLRLGADPTGLSASVDVVTDAGTPPTVVTVGLLPSVSGLDRLAGAAAQRLLPAVLDALVDAVGARTPHPAVLDEALAVADALGVHDSVGGFSAHADALATLATDLAAGGAASAQAAAAAVRAVLRRLLGVPLVPAGATPMEVAVEVPDVLGGTLELRADLGTGPPSLRVALSGLAAGPATLGVEAGYAAPDVLASVDVGLAVDTGLGLVLAPRLSAGLAVDTAGGAAGLAVELRPLGTDDVVVALAPVPTPPTAEDLLALAGAWLVPLAGGLGLRAAADVLDVPLWTGGRTAADLLVASGAAVRETDGSLVMAPALPTPAQLLRGALDALTGLAVPLPGGPALELVADGTLYGVVVTGAVDVPAGDLSVSVHFGLPDALDVGWGQSGAGVGVLLLDLTDPDGPAVTPVLRLGGLGLRLGAATAGKALVDTGVFRLGAAAAYLRADLPLTGTAALRRPASIDGALSLEDLGLPFAGGDTRSNPVAGSMLQQDPSGDQAPVNPPLDMLVGRSGPVWTVLFAGETEIVFEIHRSFGPLHIEELALLYRAAGAHPGQVGLSVDGGVAVAGLSVDVDDLSLLVPLDAPADVDRWEVDLAGLSVGLLAGPVTIAGGLLKATLDDGTIDYEGMLAVEIAGRGFTAVGAYAQPSDQLGDYTSLFVFVSVPIPIGGPPYLFILGFGGGVGYNRRLLVPRDPTGVPSFPLVAAISGGGFSADEGPMAALREIAEDIPPARGAVWVAAGVKFSTFELLHTTAVAYVAVDRGLEVGVLGLMQMVLPADAAAVVSVELALAARYSTVDQILSVRAELTSNSWLISPDCRLTGGFAFVVWFDKPDVLLSIGGYGPLFDPPDDYPSVPPVGFNWSVGGGIVVKGESYFALTPAALTFGGRLEASYDVSPVRVWFTVHLDVLIVWDPFSYVLDAGVSIGASFTIKVCFFACVRISVSVSLGATVHLDGPPLHATVTVDLAIARVTVEFGSREQQAYLSWPEASLKYLGGGTGRSPTTAGIAAGGRPPEGGTAPDGTEDRPWAVAPEFALRVESVMPLASWQLTGGGPGGAAGGRAVDVVPCGNGVGRVGAALALTLERRTGPATWAAVPAATLAALVPSSSTTGFPVAVWDAVGAGDPTGGGDTMVTALSSVQLATATTVTEATGSLGEIPFSALVEEEVARPLFFGAAVGGIGVRGPRSRTRFAGRAPLGRSDAAARRPPAARLRAVVPGPAGAPAASRAVVRGRAGAPAAARAVAVGTAEAPVPLPAGGAPLRDVDPDSRHRLVLDRERGRTLPLRMVALTGTGAVVADRPARAGMPVPADAARVVLAPAAGDTAGWDAGTPLVPLGPGTLLAPGATVRLPRPWTPPPRYRRSGEHVPVPAALLTAGVDGLVTDLPATVRTVVVRLDRVPGGPADLAGVRVEVTGAASGPVESTVTGDRARLTVPVTADGTARLSVAVTTRPGWRLAGVTGSRDESDRAGARRRSRAARTRDAGEEWFRLSDPPRPGAPVAAALAGAGTGGGSRR